MVSGLRLQLRPSALHPGHSSSGSSSSSSNSNTALPLPLPLSQQQRRPPPHRPYATHHHQSAAESRRRAVTPFNDDGRVPWTELSAGEKTARAAQQTFNFGMVILGVVLTVSRPSPARMDGRVDGRI